MGFDVHYLSRSLGSGRVEIKYENFRGKCNEVNYKDERYIVFKNKNGGNEDILALIPHSRIVKIVNHGED